MCVSSELHIAFQSAEFHCISTVAFCVCGVCRQTLVLCLSLYLLNASSPNVCLLKLENCLV